MTGSKVEAMTQRDWLSRKQVEHIKRVSDKDHVWDASSMDNLEYEETQALCSMALAYLDAQEWRPIADAPGNKQVLIAAWYDGAWYIFTGEALFWKATFENKHLRWLPLPQPPQQKERPQ